MFKQFISYGKKSALKLNVSNKGDIFLSLVEANGKDNNGNITFDWNNEISINIGQNDIISLISYVKGYDKSCTLFHQTPTYKKIVNFSTGTGDFANNVSISINYTTTEGNTKRTIFKSITKAEFLLMIDIIKTVFIFNKFIINK